MVNPNKKKNLSVYDIYLHPPESLFKLYYCRLQQVIADNFSKSQALIYLIVYCGCIVYNVLRNVFKVTE